MVAGIEWIISAEQLADGLTKEMKQTALLNALNDSRWPVETGRKGRVAKPE